MSEQQNQISLFAGKVVEFQRYLGSMSTEDRQWAIQNTKDAIILFAEAIKNRATKAPKKLLQFLFSFTTQAIKKFIAKEKFIKGKTVDGVSIAWFGENFEKNFLGKTEENVEAVELKVHKLLEAARDLQKDDELGIIPELNGKHETKLAQFHQLLAYKQQKKDFSWTIAYIPDENENLWAVFANWDSDDDGWIVGAHSVGPLVSWNAFYQVVSR